MNRYRMQFAPHWWSPKLNPTMVRLLRTFRRRKRINQERLLHVEIRGSEIVRQAVEAGHGVLITPNHPTHADAYTLYDAADAVGLPFYIMSAWQVFDSKHFFGRWVLRWHGCFSVDREATDLRAFRQAVEVLQQQPYPLVIFPEGEVYHCNDRVTPFREGAAAIALSAARRAKRPVACIPCAIRYWYVQDPSKDLLQLMDELERQIFWRPRPDRSLHQRIYAFAEAALALKEMEFLGQGGTGTLPERIDSLCDAILRGLEQRYQVEPGDAIFPQRVKELRRVVLTQLESLAEEAPQRKQQFEDLDDLFLVVQLFSYPGDYVAERPTIERMAETLDKFEEDVLDNFTAKIRGARHATVAFGEPVPVETDRKAKDTTSRLTETLEQRVQALLDGNAPSAPSPVTPQA